MCQGGDFTRGNGTGGDHHNLQFKGRRICMLYIYCTSWKTKPYANKYRSYAGELCAIVVRNSYAHLCAPVPHLMRAALGCTYLCVVMIFFVDGFLSMTYSTHICISLISVMLSCPFLCFSASMLLV